MGVDFTGVSELRSEPLPARFRPEWKAARAADITALEREIAANPEYASLILSLSGGYLDAEGGVVLPDSVEPSYAMSAEFERTIGAEKDFFAVDWEGSRIWRTTEASVQTSVGRNYGGYAEFRNFLYRLNGRPFYMPSDTDGGPERGFVTSERCVECLSNLDRLRHHFVSDAWKPGMGEEAEELYKESWFFCKFYTVLWRGSQSGCVLIH